MLRISIAAAVCFVLSVVAATNFDYDCASLLPNDLNVNKTAVSNASYVLRILNADNQLDNKFRKDEKVIVEISFGKCVITGLAIQARRPLGTIAMGSWLVTSDKQRTHQCKQEADSLTNVDSEPVCVIKAEWLPPVDEYVKQVEIVGTIVTGQTMWAVKSILLENEDEPREEKPAVGEEDAAPVHYDPREFEERPNNRFEGEEEDASDKEEEQEETEDQSNGGEDPNEPEKLDEQQRDAANKADMDGEKADEQEEREEQEEQGQEQEREEEEEAEKKDDHGLQREEEMAAKLDREHQQAIDDEDANGEAVEADEAKEKEEHEKEIQQEQTEMEERVHREYLETQKRLREEIRDKEEFDRIKAEKVVPLEKNNEILDEGKQKESEDPEVGAWSGSGTSSFSFLLASLLFIVSALFI